MMIACSECQRDVSSKASTCPGCGAPIAERVPRAVTMKPNVWNSPNVGCAAGALLILAIAVFLVSRC